ncbi:MAG: hypothetical protein MZV64_49260 [Ignavibacteriales bacterium]|nr:hypothetical protein [Ignavibacteriales bacterium]
MAAGSSLQHHTPYLGNTDQEYPCDVCRRRSAGKIFDTAASLRARPGRSPLDHPRLVQNACKNCILTEVDSTSPSPNAPDIVRNDPVVGSPLLPVPPAHSSPPGHGRHAGSTDPGKTMPAEH